MSRRGRRRAGATRYQVANRRLPRAEFYSPELEERAPLRRGPRATPWGVWGRSPHAERKDRARRAAETLPGRVSRVLMQWTPGTRREALKPANHFLQALLSVRKPVAPLMATVLGDRPQIRNPVRAPVCVRRQDRREVLFARKVAGRPGGSPGRRRTYRRNEASEMSCR